MAVFRDLSLLWSLSHILIIFMLLYRSRYSRNKTFLLTGIIMGPLILLNVVGLAIYGAELIRQNFHEPVAKRFFVRPVSFAVGNRIAKKNYFHILPLYKTVGDTLSPSLLIILPQRRDLCKTDEKIVK